MGAKSDIEWTDATWSPFRGCSRKSPGCEHCYAESIARRFSGPGKPYSGLINRHGVWNGKTVFAPEHLTDPIRWVRPRRIFVNSMSDTFHESVPFEWIDKLFSVMSCTCRHTYQVLTKRPERMLDYFLEYLQEEDVDFGDGGAPDPGYKHEHAVRYCGHFDPKQINALNVWPQWIPQHGNRGGYDNCGPIWPLVNVEIGVSVEDQERADERIPLLLKVPARTRFLSCEPLLGPIDLRPYFLLEPLIDWVIVGGESGHGARPMNVRWAYDIIEQCQKAGVPVFMKQLGKSPVCEDGTPYPLTFDRAKGGDPEDWHPALRVREFPRGGHDGARWRDA